MGQQELHIVLLSNDPNRAYPALTLAMGAVAMGARAKVYCTMAGLDIVRKEGADKLGLPGMPPLGQMLRDALKSGVAVCACGPSPEVLRQMGISEETIEEGVQVEDVLGFLSEALPAAERGGVVTFI